jgi:translation initiation factor IF-3
MVRVVDDAGQPLGIMSPRDAMRIAGEKQLDLIEIAPAAEPPVCKIMAYGKFRYEHQKREKQSRSATHTQQMKEVRLRPNIDSHDIDFKSRHVREFLLEGHKIKITVVYRGREMAFRARGEGVLRSFIAKVADIAKVENDMRMEGNRLSVLIGPTPSAAAKKVEKKVDDKKIAEKKSGKKPETNESNERIASSDAPSENTPNA